MAKTNGEVTYQALELLLDEDVLVLEVGAGCGLLLEAVVGLATWKLSLPSPVTCPL